MHTGAMINAEPRSTNAQNGLMLIYIYVFFSYVCVYKHSTYMYIIIVNIIIYVLCIYKYMGQLVEFKMGQ